MLLTRNTTEPDLPMALAHDTTAPGKRRLPPVNSLSALPWATSRPEHTCAPTIETPGLPTSVIDNLRTIKNPASGGALITELYFLFGNALGKNIVLLATGSGAVFFLLLTLTRD